MQYNGCVFYEIVILNQDEDENDESSEDVSACLVHALGSVHTKRKWEQKLQRSKNKNAFQ